MPNSNRRRFLIADGSIPPNPKKYVTISVTGNSSTQYYDGTAKTFTGTPTITYSPSYSGFRATVKSTKTITQTNPGIYTFTYTEDDFNITTPNDGYDYEVTWDIKTWNVIIEVYDAFNTTLNYYNSKIFIDGVKVSPVSYSSVAGNWTDQQLPTGTYYWQNYDLSDTVCLISVGYMNSERSNVGRTISNLQIKLNGTYFTLKEAVQSLLIDSTVLIREVCDNWNTGGGILNLYSGGSYSTGVMPASSPWTRGGTINIIITLKENNHLTDVRYNRKDTTSSTIYESHGTVYDCGKITIQYNYVNPYHSKNTRTYYYDNLLSINNNTDSIDYSKMYAFNSNSLIASQNNFCYEISYPAESTVVNSSSSISISNSTVRYEYLLEFPQLSNNSVKLYLTELLFKFNSTYYSLKDAVDYGFIEPVVVIQCSGTNLAQSQYSGDLTCYLNNIYSGSEIQIRLGNKAYHDGYYKIIIYFTVKAIPLTGVNVVSNTSDQAQFPQTISLGSIESNDFRISDSLDNIDNIQNNNLTDNFYNNKVYSNNALVNSLYPLEYNSNIVKGNFTYDLESISSSWKNASLSSYTLVKRQNQLIHIQINPQLSSEEISRQSITLYYNLFIGSTLRDSGEVSLQQAVQKGFIYPIVLLTERYEEDRGCINYKKIYSGSISDSFITGTSDDMGCQRMDIYLKVKTPYLISFRGLSGSDKLKYLDADSYDLQYIE